MGEPGTSVSVGHRRPCSVCRPENLGGACKILKPVSLMVAEVGSVASLSREMGKEHACLSLFIPSGPSAVDVDVKQLSAQREYEFILTQI